jgi:C4-type Zn-finger protein
MRPKDEALESGFVVCPLCGRQFDPKANQACSKCPFKKGCQVVCCPNCGYQTVVEGKLGDAMKKLFSKEGGHDGSS